MEAYIEMSEFQPGEVALNDILLQLKERNISFGIMETALENRVNTGSTSAQSLLAAIGKDPVHGKDGAVVFEKPYQLGRREREKADFRDILSIPSVQEGERIAYLTPPTRGIDGKNIYGEVIKAVPGKLPRLKPGENIAFKSADYSYYSKIDGQISSDERGLHVQPLFEVRGDLDLKTGNLDFVGSIIINGNVPAGYCLKARGDITVYGMVEGAQIYAGGSIHVSEGIAGLGKSFIKANQFIRAGYINQATVEAGEDIVIQNSILHSDCVANRGVFCLKGNIIGGRVSAGSQVKAFDIGNRMNTKTGIYVGMNKNVEEKRRQLSNQLSIKQVEKEKLVLLGNKLDQKKRDSGNLSSKERIAFLRQRKSLMVTEEDIEDLTNQIKRLESTIRDLKDAKVQAEGKLFDNVQLGFGHYEFRVKSLYSLVEAVIHKGEIVLRPLEDSLHYE